MNNIIEITKEELFELVPQLTEKEVKDLKNITIEEQVEVTKDFIEKEIFPDLIQQKVEFIKNNIDTKTLNEIYNITSGSEKDEKVIVHLIKQGYEKYILSIFNLYPIGDTMKKRQSSLKYINTSIRNAKRHTGITDDLVPILRNLVRKLPKNVLEDKIDEVCLKISKIKNIMAREPIIIAINQKTKFSLKLLKDRIKHFEFMSEINPEDDEKDLNELLSMPITKVKWNINPVFLSGQSTLIYGETSTFKTGFTLLMNLLMLSDQKYMFGRFPIFNDVKPKIVFYCLDMDKDLFITLVRYFKHNINLTDNDMKNFKVRTSWAGVEKELSYIEKRKFNIVNIDCLRRVIIGDENKSEVTNAFHQSFVNILTSKLITTIVIHHSGKPKEKNGIRQISVNNARGSSDIPTGYDTSWELEKIKDIEDEIPDDYIVSVKPVIKDYDIVASRAKDSRVLADINKFTFHVHADEEKQMTDFKFLYYHKAKNKERMKNNVLEYIKTHKDSNRTEMVNYFESDFKEATFDKYIAELKEEGKIKSTGAKKGEGAGIYSINEGIKIEDNEQTTLDELKEKEVNKNE